MSPSLLSLYVSVSFVVSASPGPLMLACMSNGARYGVRPTLATMMGASFGNLILMLLSALGLGLLVRDNPLLFNAIKWLGAGYLIFLGLQMMRSSPNTSSQASPAVSPSNIKSLWLSGMMISLSNPKGLIYFGALFPQFIDYQQPLIAQFALLTIIFLTLDLGWMLIYAIAGSRLMAWLKAPKHQQLFTILSGLVLIGAGLMMFFSGALHQ